MLCGKGYESCLTIQDDGMIFRKGIEAQFLEKYDYVGAPWVYKEGENNNRHLLNVTNPHFVGNGGLSLRNVKMMCDIVADAENTCARNLFNNDMQPIPEDVFFSYEVFVRKGRIPTKEVAMGFSSEEILNMVSLGVHKMWAYHGPQQFIEYLKLTQ